MIGNKIPNKITEVSGTSPHNSLGTVTKETEDGDREIPKERYISPEKRQLIIDD